jgi:hypothetical protein
VAMEHDIGVGTGAQHLCVDGQLVGDRPGAEIVTLALEVDQAHVLVDGEQQSLFLRATAAHEHRVGSDTHAHVTQDVLRETGVRQDAAGQRDLTAQRGEVVRRRHRASPLFSVGQDADMGGRRIGPVTCDAQRVVCRLQGEPVGAQQLERVTPGLNDLDGRLDTTMIVDMAVLVAADHHRLRADGRGSIRWARIFGVSPQMCPSSALPGRKRKRRVLRPCVSPCEA